MQFLSINTKVGDNTSHGASQGLKCAPHPVSLNFEGCRIIWFFLPELSEGGVFVVKPFFIVNFFPNIFPSLPCVQFFPSLSCKSIFFDAVVSRYNRSWEFESRRSETKTRTRMKIQVCSFFGPRLGPEIINRIKFGP